MIQKLYSFFTFIHPAFAQDNPIIDNLKEVAEGGTTQTRYVPGFFSEVAPGTGFERLAIFIGTLVNFLLSFLGVIFLLLIIYAGFRWMFSRGNEEEVTKAQKIMISSFQGLVIVVIAYAVVQFVGVIFANFIQ